MVINGIRHWPHIITAVIYTQVKEGIRILLKRGSSLRNIQSICMVSTLKNNIVFVNYSQERTFIDRSDRWPTKSNKFDLNSLKAFLRHHVRKNQTRTGPLLLWHLTNTIPSIDSRAKFEEFPSLRCSDAVLTGQRGRETLIPIFPLSRDKADWLSYQAAELHIFIPVNGG